MVEKSRTHEMRRLSGRCPDANVHRGLAEPDRRELRMRVGEVQQRDVAERRQVVELAGRLRRAELRPERRARRRRGGENLEEISALQTTGLPATRDRAGEP